MHSRHRCFCTGSDSSLLKSPSYGLALEMGNIYQFMRLQGVGLERYMRLPMFHDVTLCHLSMEEKRRQTRQHGMPFSDVTRAFCTITTTPLFINEWMELLERYVVLLLCNRTSSQTTSERGP